MPKEKEPIKKRVSEINVWKPANDNQIYMMRNDKKIICRFAKIYNQKSYAEYEEFVLNKGSYENKLDLIIKYINYFINKYDTDLELIGAYLKIKFALKKHRDSYGPDSTPAYIDLVYELIFTPTIVEKIKRCTEDNYFDDVESGVKRVNYKNNRKHLESLEFTNKHVKIMLAISLAIKIICPVVFDFFSTHKIKIEKKSDMIYNFYKGLFPLFQEDCDMYAKLYLYVKAKILESLVNNQKMFDQREIFGVDPFTVINDFTKRVLISENMFKYEFGGNILGFNRTVTTFQITCFLKAQYEKNLAEVTMEKNTEGLSAIDKMNMNLTKIDEGIVVLSEINVKNTIEWLKAIFDVGVTDDEIDFYMKHHIPSEIQVFLVNSFYAQYFGSYRDLNLLTKRQYITLLVLLKKKLILDLGFDDNGCIHATALPYILSGNLVDKLNNRVIRNLQFKSQRENCYLYNQLKEGKHKYIYAIGNKNTKNGKNDIDSSIASSLINTNFTFVDYAHPELLDKPMRFSDSKISYEVMYFLSTLV